MNNVKLAAVFNSEEETNSIFYGSNSILKLRTTTKDNQGNVICEFNELMAENSILQTNYTATGDKIVFDCSFSQYYSDALNNYKNGELAADFKDN
jgi:hypothetical protein